MVALDRDRARWFTSTHSNNGGNCVEVALLDAGSGVGQAGRAGRADLVGAAAAVAVRDSKNRCGPSLLFGAPQWRAFLRGVRTGRFDPTLADRVGAAARGRGQYGSYGSYGSLGSS